MNFRARTKFLLQFLTFLGCIYCSDFEPQEIEASDVWIAKNATDYYTLSLLRKFSKDVAITSSITSSTHQPFVRVTKKCRADSDWPRYCGLKSPTDERQEDIVSEMVYQGGGVYALTFNTSGLTDPFTPLVYFAPDTALVDAYIMKDTDDFRTYESHYTVPETISASSSTAPRFYDYVNAIQSREMSILMSTAFYATTQGSQQLEIEHESCMMIKINGKVVYEAMDDCDSLGTYNEEFSYYFDINIPYFIELFATKAYASYTMNFGFQSTSYPFDPLNRGATNAYQPILYQASTRLTIEESPFEDISLPSKFFFAALLILMFTALILTMISFYYLEKKIVAFYNIIHYLQLLLLTPLVNYTLGDDMMDFYDQIDFFLFNFSFLPKEIKFTDYDETKPTGEFKQDVEYLTKIELETASGINNLGKFITVLIFLICFILIVVLLRMMTKKTEKSGKWARFINWMYEWCIFALPIRFFLLSFPYVYLCVFSEITISNNLQVTSSWVISLIIFIIYSCVPLVVIAYWIASADEEFGNSLEPCEELFLGCQFNFIRRSWPLMWILRAGLFVFVVCLAYGKNPDLSLKLIMLINLMYCVYLGVARPFQRWVDFIVEVFNSVMLQFLLFSIFSHRDEPTWDTWVVYLYLACIIITVAIDVMIIAGWGITHIIILLYEQAKRRKYEQAFGSSKGNQKKKEEKKEEQKEAGDHKHVSSRDGDEGEDNSVGDMHSQRPGEHEESEEEKKEPREELAVF